MRLAVSRVSTSMMVKCTFLGHTAWQGPDYNVVPVIKGMFCCRLFLMRRMKTSGFVKVMFLEFSV